MTKSKDLQLSLLVTTVCLLFVYFIGVTHLKYDPIAGDEYRSLTHIFPPWRDDSFSVVDTINRVALLSAQHAPLYFVLLNGWEELAGNDLFSLRLLSTYFGVLSIAAMFRLASLTGYSRDARAAAFALAFHAFYVFYTHELRMYTLLGAATCWTVWSYWILANNRSYRLWAWLSFLLAAVALLYTHYMGAVLLAAMALYHLVFVVKDRRWWRIAFLFAVAGISFLPWLQVVISGVVEHSGDPDVNPFTRLEAVRVVLAFLSNGISVLPIVVAGLLIAKLKQLAKYEVFILFVSLVAIVLLFVLNEFIPVLVEWRVRYVIIVLPLLACAAAIATRNLPNWPYLRPILALGWIAAYVICVSVEDAATEKGVRTYTFFKTPHYQDFVYHADELPGHDELILSFHPTRILADGKQLPYYRGLTPKWADITHIAYDSDGELVIQSGLSSYATLDGISESSLGVWVIYNPQHTDLMSMPVYADWFLQHFKMCKRYLERDVSIIDYYVKLSIPCELIAAERPSGILYDNETELGNYVVEATESELKFHFWWRNMINRRYAFSLQFFDESLDKVGQQDRIISGEPIDIISFDIASLTAGTYTVQFIVYEIESNKSQPGTTAIEGSRFERETELYSFSVDAA